MLVNTLSMGLMHLGFMSHVFLVDARLIVGALREVSGQKNAHPLLFHQPRKVQTTLPCVWVATGSKRKVGISNATAVMQVMSLAERRWIHAILQCFLTHNKTAVTQSELTNQGIDKLPTLSRGIFCKEDILKPVRTLVAILGSLGVCIYVPASRHWLISYSPIHLT